MESMILMLARFFGRLTTAELNRIVGVCEGILSDKQVTRAEVEFLSGRLEQDERYAKDPRTQELHGVVRVVMRDSAFTPATADELRIVLSDFCDRVLNNETPLPTASSIPSVAAPEVKPTTPAEPPITGDLFEISYVDAKGDATLRTIEFRSSDGVYVNAYCHTRGAFRTFRTDRIVYAVNEATGEFISDPV